MKKGALIAPDEEKEGDETDQSNTNFQSSYEL